MTTPGMTTPGMIKPSGFTDEEFLEHVADALASLPHVRAVALGGSRATGTQTPASDWDVAVYYRGHFRPDDLRALGWPGEVSEVGGWGGGVFNGGGWLTVDGRRVDVHYRDLDVIDDIWRDARAGDFRVEPLMFHLNGIPTYLLLAELALNRTLRGELPRPEYPEALRARAPVRWWEHGRALFDYARNGAAPQGRATLCVGLVTQGAMCVAHAVCAAEGMWVTNEKRLIATAGLREVDERLAHGARPTLSDLVEAVEQSCRRRLEEVRPGLTSTSYPRVG